MLFLSLFHVDLSSSHLTIEASELGEITPSKYAVLCVASLLSFSLPLRREPGVEATHALGDVCTFTHVWCFSLETCSVHFDNPDDFRRFRVTIKPGLSGYPQYTTCTTQDILSIFPVQLRISSAYSLYISASILPVHLRISSGYPSICQYIPVY